MVHGLTAAGRRVDVVGRVLDPGGDRDVLLDEGRYLAAQDAGVAGQDVGVAHQDLVLLAHHCGDHRERLDIGEGWIEFVFSIWLCGRSSFVFG